MRGHLITSTGIPSHGKSTFVEWYVLNLIKDYKMKASFFSPEHSPMELHQAHFIQKTFAKNYFKSYSDTPRVSKEDILGKTVCSIKHVSHGCSSKKASKRRCTSKVLGCRYE